MKYLYLKIMCLVFSFYLTSSAFAQAGFTDGRVYQLVSKFSGKCLDVKDRATHEGATLQQWDRSSEAHQKFRARHIGYGLIQLRALHVDKCVTFTGDGYTEDGGRAVLSSECSGYSHAFVSESVGGADYRLKTTGSSSIRCLDVDGPSYANGAVAQEWTCSNGDNQKWLLKEVSESPPPPIDYTGEYTFQNVLSGSCLDVTDHSKASGTRLQQWGCTNAPNQAFRLLKSDASVYIRAVESNLFLRTDADRRYVIQYDSPRPTYHAEWGFEPSASVAGAYQLRFRDSNTCLTLELYQGYQSNGSAAILSPCTGSRNQLWWIKKKT